MDSVAFLLLLFAIGTAGWFSWHLVFPPRADGLYAHFLILITGVGTTSMALLLLGISGFFRPGPFYLLYILLLVAYLGRHLMKKESLPIRLFLRYAIFLVVLGCASLVSFSTVKPFQAVLGAQDATAFIGTSHYIVKHGSVRYRDSLAAEMTLKERETLFKTTIDRPERDVVVRIRHQGGFMLFESKNPEVTVGFFHLFPLWLALGNLALGVAGFQYVMTLLSMLNVLTLFLIGSSLGGRLLGFSLAILSVLFFPQAYHFLMPLSEVLLELLLLSGLLLFMSESKRLQVLIGVLFGAALFTKLEVLIFLPLSLGLSFTAIPRLRAEIRQWSGLILTVAFFYLLSIHYHFDNGNYFYQIHNWCRDMPVARDLFFIIEESPAHRAALFLALWLFLALLLRIPRLKLAVTCLTLSIFTVFFFVFIKLRFDFERTLLTFEWFGYYMDRWVLFLLLAGLVLFLVPLILGEGKARIAFVFFAVPAVIYCIDPMVHGYHPFAIRRFVPLFFPLLLALSCKGWLFTFRRIPAGCLLQYAAFGLLTASMAFAFSRDTIPILDKPLFNHLMKPIKKAMDELPEDALVIVSDELAGLGMHMTVQYLGGRDTLMNKLTSPEFLAYMGRQLKQRKVYLILQRSASPLDGLYKHFGMTFNHGFQTSCLHIKQDIEFTGSVKRLSNEYLIFELFTKSRPADIDSIDIGDPRQDLPFLKTGFHYPEGEGENTYRWTSGEAVMALPPAERIRITVAGRGPDTRLEIKINEEIVFHLDELSAGRITLEVPGRPEEFLLTLNSSTFSPALDGKGADNRDLGVRLYAVELF